MPSLPHINAATKEIRKYLNSLESDAISETAAISALETIIKRSSQEDKIYVHMQLLFHLPFDELSPIHEDPGEFIYLVPAAMTFKGISPNLYCELVVKGGLIYHFIQMVAVLYQKKFVRQLLTDVMNRFWSSKHDTYPQILFMLSKICRCEENNDNEAAENKGFFFNEFQKFLDQFVKAEEIPRFQKLHLLIRLVGVSCMQKSDYIGQGSDLLEMIEEWNYDLTNRIAYQTKENLIELFSKKKEEELERPLNIEVLTAIDTALTNFIVTEEDEKLWMELPKTRVITWLEYIGVHAFLTKSMLEKYSSLIPEERFNDLMTHANKWATFKPKLTREDFQGEIVDFIHFYKVLKRFGDKERDRKILLPQFLEFSYMEVFGTKEGLRIAEKYIINGADFDTALDYILAALDFDSMPSEMRGIIPETARLIILKILCCNPEVTQRKEEVVTRVFSSGVHSDLALPEFAMSLNQICSKIGSIEKEDKNPALIEHNQDLIYNICFQNPIVAVENLFKQAVRSQQFKVLLIAKPFLLLTSGSKGTPTVINYCLEKILESFYELDPFVDCLCKALYDLVSNDLINAKDLYEFVRYKIEDLVVANTVNLDKIVKLFSFLDALADSLLASFCKNPNVELLRKIYNFALSITTYFYTFINKNTHKQMMMIRKTCLKIQNQIANQSAVKLPKVDEQLKDIKFLTEMSLLEVGFVYIRVGSIREQISSFMIETNIQKEVRYGTIQQNLVTWVVNSEPDNEWPVIIPFISDILLSSNDKLQTMSRVQFFNDSVHSAYRWSVISETPLIIRQYLKFYTKCIQQFWDENVNQSESEKFNQKDQINVVKTFIALILIMNENMNKMKTLKEKSVEETSLQQVFLVLLEEISLIITKNQDFEMTMKEDILDLVLLTPVIIGNCEPIRKCIIDRVLKTKRHTLDKDGNSCNNEQDFNVATVSIAEEGVREINLSDPQEVVDDVGVK